MTSSVSPTPFHDLAAFTALPRCSGLVLSPDGSLLVVGVTTLDTEGTGHHTALWGVDPEGARPARRLTRGESDEHDAAFTPDGDLVFLASRSAPMGAKCSPQDGKAWLPLCRAESRNDCGVPISPGRPGTARNPASRNRFAPQPANFSGTLS